MNCVQIAQNTVAQKTLHRCDILLPFSEQGAAASDGHIGFIPERDRNSTVRLSVMKMFKMVLLAGAVLLPMSAVARAADIAPDVPSDVATSQYGMYLRADAGWSFLRWSGGADDDAFVFGGGLGYQFTDMFRADLTADWAGKYTVAPGAKLSTTTVLANGYIDFANDTMFTPYVGAGAGYGWVNGSGTAPDDSGFAVGLAAGVAVDLTSNLAVDVGYRFRDTMITGPDVKEHQATVGLRFKF
jgi:opacity protein-like surface antigen